MEKKQEQSAYLVTWNPILIEIRKLQSIFVQWKRDISTMYL